MVLLLVMVVITILLEGKRTQLGINGRHESKTLVKPNILSKADLSILF